MSLFDDIVVALNYSYPHYGSIEYLRNLYCFPRVIHYGPPGVQDERVIPLETAHGLISYRIFHDLFDRAEGARGVMLVHDDFLLNRSRFETLDPGMVWSQPRRRDDIQRWWWWNHPMGSQAWQAAAAELGCAGAKIEFGFSDLMYVPAAMFERFRRPFAVCAAHKVFVELAWPNLVSLLTSPSERQFLNTVDHVRCQHGHANWQRLYAPSLHGIHPVKWSDAWNRKEALRLLSRDSLNPARIQKILRPGFAA